MLTLEERFWTKVQKRSDDECWHWTAARGKFGHGRFRTPSQSAALAHRVSWTLAYGEPPEDMKVCHTCDVPYCVNPNHLFLGTQAENVRDMINKGRAKFRKVGDPPTHKGETSSCSKLSEAEVQQIKCLREGGMKLIEIADRYHISYQHVSRICKGKRRGGGPNS